jgi:hypothetical protein
MARVTPLEHYRNIGISASFLRSSLDVSAYGGFIHRVLRGALT